MNPTPVESLDPLARAFLDRCFTGPRRIREITRLEGDASTRQYLRCRDASGASCILTVYPTAVDADRFSYRQIYELLRNIGIPVPEIIAVDTAHGFLLQEDLGNLSMERCAREFPQRLGEHQTNQGHGCAAS